MLGCSDFLGFGVLESSIDHVVSFIGSASYIKHHYYNHNFDRNYCRIDHFNRNSDRISFHFNHNFNHIHYHCNFVDRNFNHIRHYIDHYYNSINRNSNYPIVHLNSIIHFHLPITKYSHSIPIIHYFDTVPAHTNSTTSIKVQGPN